MAKALNGSKTHDNLKTAFAGESQANRRYLYFARRADIEGYPDVGGLFRDTSEAETGHAFGHLDFLKEVGDPCTGVAIGDTEKNLKSAVEGETSSAYMKDIPRDPWDNDYEYRVTSNRDYTIRCFGQDGQPDTEDDLWHPPRPTRGS